MTLTRRRMRVSKYNILVNTVGAVVGAKLTDTYFINIKHPGSHLGLGGRRDQVHHHPGDQVHGEVLKTFLMLTTFNFLILTALFTHTNKL